MTEYLSEIRNGILNFRSTFDRDISVENVRGEVVIGRSSTLTVEQRKAFEKHASSLDFSVITYDELFERAKENRHGVSLNSSITNCLLIRRCTQVSTNYYRISEDWPEC